MNVGHDTGFQLEPEQITRTCIWDLDLTLPALGFQALSTLL